MIHLVVGHGRFARAVKVPLWMIGLTAGAIFVLGLLLLTLIASAAILALPVLIIAVGAARFLSNPGRSAREPIFTGFRTKNPNVIEGEYRIVDKDRR